jgi:hypothetical protein
MSTPESGIQIHTPSRSMSQSGRRIRHRAPLSQAEIELGMTLVSAFLQPGRAPPAGAHSRQSVLQSDLDALRTCSRAMKEVATADAVWSAHTRRMYPWARNFSTVGGASAITGRREYLRMKCLSWRVGLRKPAHKIPGVDAYSALVVVKYKGDIIVDGLFDMVPDDAPDGYGPAVVDVAPAGSLLKHSIAFENFFSDVSISVVVVRKADGKAMEFFYDAKAEPWESFDGDEGVVEIHGCAFNDGLQDPDEDSPFQLMMNGMSWAERDEVPESPILTGWRSLAIERFCGDSLHSILRLWDRSKLWI